MNQLGMKTGYLFIVGLTTGIIGCYSPSRVAGLYTSVFSSVSSEKFVFAKKPNTFSYFSQTEGSMRSFSSGTWTHTGTSIVLSGFMDSAINFLQVLQKEVGLSNSTTNEIIINYKKDPLVPFIKAELILNNNEKFSILNDTILSVSTSLKTLQVKSYLAPDGYSLQAPPTIDTLISSKFYFDQADKPKRLALTFATKLEEFYRIKMRDSIKVQDPKTLLWRGVQLIKTSKR